MLDSLCYFRRERRIVNAASNGRAREHAGKKKGREEQGKERKTAKKEGEDKGKKAGGGRRQRRKKKRKWRQRREELEAFLADTATVGGVLGSVLGLKRSESPSTFVR